MKTIVAAIVVSASAFAAQAATVSVSTVLDAQQSAAALNNVLAPTSTTGVVNTNVVGSISGVRRSPYDTVASLAGTGKYHSIQGNASATYAFGELQDSFTLLWGSPDNFNFLTFFNGQDQVNLGTFGASLSGNEIAPLGPIAPLGTKLGVVTIADIVFDRVVLSSTRNAFEYGLVSSTPAPIPLPAAAWMLLAGLGALVGLRRRAA